MFNHLSVLRSQATTRQRDCCALHASARTSTWPRLHRISASRRSGARAATRPQVVVGFSSSFLDTRSSLASATAQHDTGPLLVRARRGIVEMATVAGQFATANVP